MELSSSLDSSDWSRDTEKQKRSKNWRLVNTLKNVLKGYRLSYIFNDNNKRSMIISTCMESTVIFITT